MQKPSVAGYGYDHIIVSFGKEQRVRRYRKRRFPLRRFFPVRLHDGIPEADLQLLRDRVLQKIQGPEYGLRLLHAFRIRYKDRHGILQPFDLALRPFGTRRAQKRVQRGRIVLVRDDSRFRSEIIPFAVFLIGGKRKSHLLQKQQVSADRLAFCDHAVIVFQIFNDMPCRQRISGIGMLFQYTQDAQRQCFFTFCFHDNSPQSS